MTARIRAIVGLSRPPVAVILGMFAALGVAQAGQGLPTVRLAKALIVVSAYVMFSASINDLSDAPIDRVNLAGDRRRPLVSGDASPTDLGVVAAVAATIMLAAAASLNLLAVAIAAIGLAVSTAYSLPPVRLSGRGAIASLILPAAYVAVPYLVGVVTVPGAPGWHSLAELPGLYAGFLGRIVLKDFRDVRGDRLFGKRTFLIRHGRKATCWFGATCWVLGGLWLAFVQDAVVPATVCAMYVAVAVILTHSLCRHENPRHDERLIAAIAITGRGMVLTLIAWHCVVASAWALIAQAALLAALFVISLGQARSMLTHGPTGYFPRTVRFSMDYRGSGWSSPAETIARTRCERKDPGFPACRWLVSATSGTHVHP